MRSPLVALAASGFVVALAGCSTFDTNNAAADVNGTEVSRDHFEEVLRALAASDATPIAEDTATGSVPASDGRDVLGLLVANAANRSFLERHGESITDADREAFAETVQGNPLLELQDDVVDELLDAQVGGTARARIAAPDEPELERLYTRSPASTGVMCVRHIVVGSEEEAEDVLDELNAGADFATLASDRSIDEATASDGGAVVSPDGRPCLPLPQAVQSVDRSVVEAAIDAQYGVPTGPFESPAGWHVVLARPFDEISDSLTELYGQGAGDLLFFGYLATADIQVDPRYGRWDPVQFRVTALA